MMRMRASKKYSHFTTNRTSVMMLSKKAGLSLPVINAINGAVFFAHLNTPKKTPPGCERVNVLIK